LNTKIYGRKKKRKKKRQQHNQTTYNSDTVKPCHQTTTLQISKIAFLYSNERRIHISTWKKGSDSVIPKKTSRSPRVDKLHTTLPHAADEIFCNKHIAKKVVQHQAEQVQEPLAQEQYTRKDK
jgi:hypothetical protein